jgi:hypothetical protein
VNKKALFKMTKPRLRVKPPKEDQMIVFVVLAQRRGDPESHHYIVSVFSNKEHAENCGQAEHYCRGGKYDCIIEERELLNEDITVLNSVDYNFPLRKYVE